MTSALPDGIPPLEETSYSRERILKDLRDEIVLPSGAIAFGTVYVDAVETDILDVLERARHEELDEPSRRLLFRGIHILGGRRMHRAYRPLVALLHRPEDDVEGLLGDAITENLSRILAGLFDGDELPLRELVTDSGVYEYVRGAALKAMAFLAFERQIDRKTFEAFLLHIDEARTGGHYNAVWHAWMTAVGVLGFTSLEARVRAAFADGRIDPMWCGRGHFDKLLRAALERPEDQARFHDEQMGYIEDILEALDKIPAQDNDRTYDGAVDSGGRSIDWMPQTPAHNPFRDVGRNDPCPCGSGKKFKKCCLPAG